MLVEWFYLWDKSIKKKKEIQKLFGLYRDIFRFLTRNNAPRSLISEEEAREINSGRQTERTIRR